MEALTVCRSLTTFHDTRELVGVDAYGLGYADLVDCFSARDYATGVFARHVDCVTFLLLAYTRNYKEYKTCHSHLFEKLHIEAARQRAEIARAVLRYHDVEGTAAEAIYKVAREDTPLVEHTAAWLFHCVRGRQTPQRDGLQDLKRDVTIEMQRAFAQYLVHLREGRWELGWAYTAFLEDCVPLVRLPLPKIQKPPAPHALEVPAAPPPPPPVIDESRVAHLPPCLQRAWLNMMHNAPSRDTNLWWQVFPDDTDTLAQIPDARRRLLEEGNQRYIRNKKQFPAKCSTLIEKKRCPLATGDIEDLPAGQRIAQDLMLRKLYAREDASPQVTCAQLCGVFRGKRDPVDYMRPSLFRP